MSKASEWAKRSEAVQKACRKLERAGPRDLPSFRIAQREKTRTRSLYAHVVNYDGEARMLLASEELTLSAIDTLRFARWILDTFEDRP